MKRAFKKLTVVLMCMSIFISYMPWNVVFASDEESGLPNGQIVDEAQETTLLSRTPTM